MYYNHFLLFVLSKEHNWLVVLWSVLTVTNLRFQILVFYDNSTNISSIWALDFSKEKSKLSYFAKHVLNFEITFSQQVLMIMYIFLVTMWLECTNCLILDSFINILNYILREANTWNVSKLSYSSRKLRRIVPQSLHIKLCCKSRERNNQRPMTRNFA